MITFRKSSLPLFVILFLLCFVTAAHAQALGSTSIAKWKDNQKAVFLLMFDDSWPSHWQVAIPALAERKMIATFYINPGKGEYIKFKQKWEEELWKTGQVYGNHTMTHQGVKDMENADEEIGKCATIITNIGDNKKPRLISFAKPGVGPGKWNLTDDQLKTVLKKFNLIDRPPFAGHGAVYHLQKTEQMLALADKAIKASDMEYLVIHGVERITPNWGYQDFWALKQDIFLPLLDGLKERRDKGDLWITDHISYHQYLTERTTAKVQPLQADAKSIKLKLTCEADPNFYNYPLTLTTQVPSTWKNCQIIQGAKKSSVKVENNLARFEAVPGTDVVQLQPSTTNP